MNVGGDKDELELTENWVGSLEGKVAVVTGASSGLGLGVARRFIEEGATSSGVGPGPRAPEENGG